MEEKKMTKKQELEKALKEKYGSVINLDGEFNDIQFDLYFKDGKPTHLQRYMSDVAKNSLKAGYNLISDLLVHPTIDEVEPILEKYPGLVLAISNEVSEQLGMAVNFTAKRV